MKRRYMVAGFVLIALISAAVLFWRTGFAVGASGVTIHDTPTMIESARLLPGDEDNPSPTYRVTYLDGQSDRLSPSDYADLLLKKDDSRSLTFKILNISTSFGIAWVVIGLLGQVMFTGRMIVQWLASEKEKQSVVPPAFWWMSLIGASMLIIYFIWRKDIIGLLGQGTGWLIYGRNLWMIYHTRKTEDS